MKRVLTLLGFGVAAIALALLVRERWLVPRPVGVGHGGAAAPSPVAAIVDLTKPSTGLASVRLEFGPGALGGRRELLLAFADAHSLDAGPRDLTIEADGKGLDPAREMFRNALLFRVGLPAGVAGVRVAYSIDPTYYPPGTPGVTRSPADARSRLTADFGVLRSWSVLPLLDVPRSSFSVAFVLPPGWTPVTPWFPDGERWIAPADPADGLDYLAFGPFDVAELPAGASRVVVATLPSSGVGASVVDAVVKREVELVAAPLRDAGPFTAVIVPESFMQGGAAGRRTIVQSPSPAVLAHEVFHWWNHASLTAADAAWFREGLTEFYGIRVAREAGAWTTEQEAACLADLAGEMRQLERVGARGLLDASMDPAMSRLVYSKGALFWLLVDRQLRSDGRYLEEAVRQVVGGGRTNLATADLKRTFSSVYDGIVDQAFDRYITGTEPLPDLGLGAPTGRSGCARIGDLGTGIGDQGTGIRDRLNSPDR